MVIPKLIAALLRLSPPSKAYSVARIASCPSSKPAPTTRQLPETTVSRLKNNKRHSITTSQQSLIFSHLNALGKLFISPLRTPFLMIVVKTFQKLPTNLPVSGTPTPYPDGSSHVHHHHHHYYYDPVTQRTRGHPHHRHRHHHDCKQKDDSRSSSSESNESGDRTGLKAPIKKLLKTKKCLIKDLKDTLLSKLF